MQPLPISYLSKSPVAYATFAGLLVAATSQGLLPQRFHIPTSPADAIVNSAEDDRGSGRLSGQTKSFNLLGFRGSGRINSEPGDAADMASLGQNPHYRGSGRLG